MTRFLLTDGSRPITRTLPTSTTRGFLEWSSDGSSDPALSPAASGRIFFNGTKFRVSENGGAYFDLGNISGSGTANTVAKWTATSTLGNSNLTDDGTITKSANTFLIVEKDTNPTVLVRNASASVVTTLGFNTTSNFGFVGTNTAQDFLILTAALEGIRVTAAGTTRVSGNAQFRGTTTESASGTDEVRIGILGGTPRIIFEDSGSTQWEIDNNAGTLRLFMPGDTRLQLVNGGASDTRLKFEGTGRIGTRTENSFVIITNDADRMEFSADGTLVRQSVGSSGRFRVESSTPVSVDVFSGTSGFVGTSSTHTLDLMSNNTGRIQITTGGNVGINVSGATNILAVQQASATDPIADAWTTYSSDRTAKTILGPAPRVLSVMESWPLYRWKRTPRALTDEVNRSFPIEYTPTAQEWNARAAAIVAAKTVLPKFTRERLGISIDDPGTPEEIIAIDGSGNRGIDLLAYIGYLHAGIKELHLRVEYLVSRLPPTIAPLWPPP